MTTDIVNRYASQDLFIAREYHDRIGDFVSRGQDSRPFSRYVDAWWVAMTIGIQRDRRTPLPSGVVKFNDGGILSSDPWRITHLELLALARGGPEALDRPAELIRMASEYANAGFPELVDLLTGQVEATLTLMLRLDGLGT